MMYQQPKRNHFISQYRLKRFANNKQILCYDKQEKKLRTQNIKNTAVIKNHNFATPIDVEKLFLGALSESEQELKEIKLEATSSEYHLIGLVQAQLEVAKELLKSSFFPFYKDKGIDKILSDSYGFEKAFAPMEGEMAKILRKIDDATGKITQKELQTFVFCEAFLALNNPKFREPVKEFYDHPFAKIGNVVLPLSDKIKKYNFQVISFDFDMFVMGDFPVLFIQKDKNGNFNIRSPYNFARLPDEIEFFLYIPITPSKIIFGQLSPYCFSEKAKNLDKIMLFMNGIIWDFANRFVYAKNIEALAISQKESGISIPAAEYYANQASSE